MLFYLKTFLILTLVSSVGIFITWAVQMSGSMGTYTTDETPLVVLILASVVAGFSLIPTWITKERKDNEIALRTGLVSAIILSIIVAIPIGILGQL